MKNTRSNIIDAARELFEKKGFAAATTREIAALAGVSEVTLFRHFSSKRALFDETLHSCLHPYVVDEYLKNGVTYDLKHDLKKIAYDSLITLKKNAPMLRMIMRDKIRDSLPERQFRNKEDSTMNLLLAYFTAMKQAGRIQHDPKMALKFFVTNVTGYFLKGLYFDQIEDDTNPYFEWMLDQVLTVLETPAGKDTE